MNLLRYLLTVSLPDDYPEAWMDNDGLSEPVLHAQEIVYSAPAFDTAQDFASELEVLTPREYRVTERIPAHDADDDHAFVQEWVFEVHSDGTAIFDYLDQDGESYRAEEPPEYVINDLERAGFEYSEA